MNDTPKTDFSNPEHLKQSFDDLWDELENLAGLCQNLRAENHALETAIGATLSALDDPMPAVREIVVQTLEENLEAAMNSTIGPEEAREADELALEELIGRFKLVEKPTRSM